MDPIESYALYLADLNPVPGRDLRRVVPVVVVSREEMNAALPTVVVCPLADRNPAGWRSRAAVRVAGKEQGVAVDQIRTIDAARLVRKTGKLSAKEAAEVRRLICDLYGTP